MRKSKYDSVLGMFLMVVVFLPLICFAQQSDVTQGKTEEFIKNANTLVTNMNADISKQSAQVKELWSTGNMQEGYRIEGEIKRTIATYKEQLGSLSAPQECLEFKTLIIRLLDLMENMHAALSEDDIQRYKSLLPQVEERSNEMQQELQKLLEYYKG